MRPETVLLGTGPLMLAEGLSLAEAGHAVRFVDEAEGPGGAWRPRALFGMEGVETGVHLAENRPLTNAWMRAMLGADLEEGSGFGLWRGRRVPLAGARVALHGGAAAKALARGRPGRAERLGLSAARALRHLGEGFAYPRGGFAELTARLVERLRARGARFDWGLRAEAAEIEGARARLRGRGWTIEAHRLVMSSRAHVPVLGAPPPVVEEGACHTSVLHIAGGAPFEGYAEVFGDALVKRARNLSSIARPSPGPGRALVAAQTRRRAGAEEVLGALRALGLADPGASLLDAHSERAALRTLSRGTVRRLGRIAPDVLRVIESTDFADCMESRLGADGGPAWAAPPAVTARAPKAAR